MGYEISMVGNLLAVLILLYKFGRETSSRVLDISAHDQQVFNAASSVRLFASAFGTGILSDWLGRKKVVLLACRICVAGILVQGVLHQYSDAVCW
ncbi:uncharacterized protein A1O9_09583 [Exophiala aquamarina CBS 119918]|uniref:Major facilitator superfamily (MFS) profile domain-containing protein n=1 Tax=Exophiala aquamarina CBS 119918 TaxID=1182545 RepID=A0A072P3Y2_9EURO|nr:uncharacterized protein A1O9_09583 [Exophiala aquamarina CBS 119918]KEF54417.1 hypothetical protein A1O9_09583 [Exophiala aquamarina CBS 119918]